MTRGQAIALLDLALERKDCLVELPYNVVEGVRDLLMEEPKQGQWLRDPFRARHWYCSECGNVISVPPRAYKYCSECGARMGDDDNDAR